MIANPMTIENIRKLIEEFKLSKCDIANSAGTVSVGAAVVLSACTSELGLYNNCVVFESDCIEVCISKRYITIGYSVHHKCSSFIRYSVFSNSKNILGDYQKDIKPSTFQYPIVQEEWFNLSLLYDGCALVEYLDLFVKDREWWCNYIHGLNRSV